MKCIPNRNEYCRCIPRNCQISGGEVSKGILHIALSAHLTISFYMCYVLYGHWLVKIGQNFGSMFRHKSEFPLYRSKHEGAYKMRFLKIVIAPFLLALILTCCQRDALKLYTDIKLHPLTKKRSLAKKDTIENLLFKI